MSNNTVITGNSAASDYLIGSGQSDQYLFSRGDGSDVIYDYDVSGSQNADRITFGEGISVDDIRLSAAGPDYTINLLRDGQPTEDQLTLQNALNDDAYRVEAFEFADGTALSMAELMTRSLAVSGTDGADQLSGGSGWHNAFYGGKGNDVLVGSTAADSYHFNRGDGQDTLRDMGGVNNSEVLDRIVFGEGISKEDLVLTTSGPHLVLTLLQDGQETGDQLTLQYADANPAYLLEEVAFADGSVVTLDSLREIKGTGADDSLLGREGQNNVFFGYKGNDTLTSSSGDDTFHFSRGDGQDTIIDNGGNDRIVFGEGISGADIQLAVMGDDLVLIVLKDGQDSGDRIILQNGATDPAVFVETLEFADGSTLDLLNGPVSIQGTDDETLTGLPGRANLFNGGKGNDVLNGSTGDDSYHFNLGDGQDLIRDAGGIDQIVFGEGISADNIEIRTDGNDKVLVLLVNGEDSANRITLQNAATDDANAIDKLVFADGTEMALTDLAEQQTPNLIQGTEQNDTLNGVAEQANIFKGLQGDDFLVGSTGDDSYHFNRGDGRDLIIDNNGNDRIVFGAGITAEDVQAVVDGSNIVLAVQQNGQDSGDQITLQGGVNSDYAVETMVFADGSVLTLDALMNPSQETEDQGSETDTADQGTETDTADQGSETDTTDQGTETDTTDQGTETDTADQGSETDTTDQGSETDTTDQGSENDNGYGNDRYYFNRGDGQDDIRDYGNNGTHTFDRIALGEGIQLEDVQLTFDSSRLLVLTLLQDGQPTEDAITLGSQGAAELGIELLEFSDGSTVELQDLHLPVVGTDGKDSQAAITDWATAFDLGAGNDKMHGSYRGDDYYFDRGDGQDILYENGSIDQPNAVDRIIFGEGISANDIRLSGNSDSFFVKLLSEGQETGDHIFVSGALDGETKNVEQLVFADGTHLEVSELLKAPFQNYGTNGHDRISGATDHANAFFGGAGNDTLYGGSRAADAYHFNRGDGADTIGDWADPAAPAVMDRIVFGEGISASDVSLTAQGTHLVLTLLQDGLVTSDKLTIQTARDYEAYRVELLEFADGSTVELSDLPVEFNGSTSADTLKGATGLSNVFEGGKGNDTLTGSTESDSYHFNRGDGRDLVIDNNGNDRIVFGTGITPDDVKATIDGNNIVLAVQQNSQDSGDQITLQDGVNSANAVETLVFADGTVQTLDTLMNPSQETADQGSETDTTGQGSETDTTDQGSETDTTEAPLQHVGTDGDDVLTGAADQPNVFYGGAGADRLTGSTSNDVFYGGTGDGDYLRGEGGADTYYFNRGDGNDHIRDDGRYDEEGIVDRIVFGEGISAEDIHVSGRGSELRLKVFENGVETGDVIRMYAGSDLRSEDFYVEELVFADGATHQLSEWLAKPLEHHSLNNNTSLLGVSGWSNAFFGGQGNDTFKGSTEADYYYFNRGDIKATIIDEGGADSIIFGEGITADDVKASVWASTQSISLVLQQNGQDSGDKIMLKDGLNSANAVETLVFADGTVLTLDALMNPSQETDTTDQGSETDTADQGSETDTADQGSETDTADQGSETDTTDQGPELDDSVIQGSVGEDALRGEHGQANSFAGGAGDDSLFGSYKADTYHFGLGDGQDNILDNGGTDQIVFGTGIALDDIRLDESGNDLVLSLMQDGVDTGDQINLQYALGHEAYAVENLAFADGSEITVVELLANSVDEGIV